MKNEFIASAIAAYTELYNSPPTRTHRFSRTKPPSGECAVVVYLPVEGERVTPYGNITMLGTAGFGSEAICADFPCELGIEVRGSLDESSTGALAAALAELAAAPLENGRVFHDGQILTNVSLPAFPRFDMAMLVDWDPVDGFHFPEPLADISCLRVVPLFAAEADFLHSQTDRHMGYRVLQGRGMDEADPSRRAAV